MNTDDLALAQRIAEILADKTRSLSAHYAIVRTVCATLVAGKALTAQSVPLPPIRPVGAIVAEARTPLKSVTSIRVLPDGRVLLNDHSARRLILLDAELREVASVMDTSGISPRRYPSQSGSVLLPYRGDSTLFLDASALAFVVVGPNGTVGRLLSMPRPRDTNLLVDGARVGVDTIRNDLLYALNPNFVGVPEGWVGDPPLPAPPDSAAVVRAGLESHQIDTVALLQTAKMYAPVGEVDADGTKWANFKFNPIAVADDWVVLPDGEIGIVRAHDYHVDFAGPATTRRAAPITHRWVRLTDSAKFAIVDSVRQKYAAHPFATRTTTRPDGTTKLLPRVPEIAGPDELPDYASPFIQRSGQVDADGNIWIREVPSANAGGDIVYDVINSHGDLSDRVQIPGGTVIEGFGPKCVYLSAASGAGASFVRVLLGK